MYVRNWQLAQPAVKEESLTDWMLYEIDQQCIDVHYKAVSRPEEAKVTGADWEWWILFDDGFVRLRVQAKKLSGGNNYAGLAYANAHGMQIQKLIQDSASVGAFPAYVFYSPNAPSPAWAPEGAHFAGAKAVDAKLLASKRSLTEVEILGITTPLSTLVCAHIVSDPSAANLARVLYAFSEEGARGEQVIDFVHDELPQYVSSFVDSTSRQPIEDGVAEALGFDALFVMDWRARRRR
jgi:hypothetical protein